MTESMMCCPLSNSGDGCVLVLDKSTPKARRSHCCGECGEAIAAGQSYERTTFKWEGEVESFKTCLSCVEIRNHFSCNGGWIYGEVWAQLSESFFPTMKAGGPCMEGLSPAAKQRLFDRRMAWYERTFGDD